MIADSEDTGKFANSLNEHLEKFLNGLDRPRILLAGAAGSGKSTLANLVLNREVCRTGSGKPVTRGIIEYSVPDFPVIVCDSEGYETGASFAGDAAGNSGQAYWSLMENYISGQDDLMEPVDVIWYCISAPGSRVTDADLRVIQGFRELRKPVAAVLTQADVTCEDTCQELRKVLVGAGLDGELVFESSRDPFVRIDRGIPELYEWTFNMLEESRRESFVIACNRDYRRKFELCRTYIRIAAAGASAPALSPIPFSDAAVITPIQLGLMGKILTVWNLSEFRNLAGAATLDTVLPLVGKTVAGNLLKMIPGAGSVLGGIINASVAASLTYGLGTALNEGCHYVCQKALNGGGLADFRDIVGSDFAKKVFEYAGSYRRMAQGVAGEQDGRGK